MEQVSLPLGKGQGRAGPGAPRPLPPPGCSEGGGAVPGGGRGRSRRKPGPSRGRGCSGRERGRGGGLICRAGIRSRFRHCLGQRGRGLGGPGAGGGAGEAGMCWLEGFGGGGSVRQPVGDHTAGSPARRQALSAPGVMPRAGWGSGCFLAQVHQAEGILILRLGPRCSPWSVQGILRTAAVKWDGACEVSPRQQSAQQKEPRIMARSEFESKLLQFLAVSFTFPYSA